ncbi:hypothetical protein ACFV9E_30555 [Streptomyces sp. NPDC059835]|uniref:hypothetical protein n=1 Tax=Streptomyces sp. NPDC059835 TaxID=3346967 RepID=UPI00366225F2
MADQCQDDWDRHIHTAGDTTVLLPAELQELLRGVGDAVGTLAKDSPVAAIEAARSLELIAQRTAYEAAHDARGQDPAEVAASLGFNLHDTRALLAGFDGWDVFR